MPTTTDRVGRGTGQDDRGLRFDAQTALARLRACWSKETSSLWAPDTPALGQCDVTALTLWVAHGGELLATPVGGQAHFYNRIDDTRIDLTADQFATAVAYADEPATPDQAYASTTPGQFETLFVRYLDDQAAPPPVLTTDRLVLTPFRSADLPLLCRFHEDPEVQRGYDADARPWPRPRIAAKLAGFIADHRAQRPTRWKLTLADGRFVGRAGVARNPATGALDLGYGLLPDQWGRGYAREIARALVAWTWAQTPDDRLTASAFVDNLASRRVLEDVGMRYIDDRDVAGELCAYYELARPVGR